MDLRASVRRDLRGITLIEMMISCAVACMILGALMLACFAISRSIRATNQYVTEVVNENRLMDYVAQDLRRAVRVAVIAGGVSTPIKDTGTTSYSVTENTVLAINIPNYYASNTPDNSASSDYKITRYPREILNASSSYNGYTGSQAVLNGVIPWNDAQISLKGKRVTRFAPVSTGSDEIQVRYYRGPRSSSDSTVCYFRSEYPANSNTATSTREIAERISDNTSTTMLAISAQNLGRIFVLQSSFSARYRRAQPSTSGTEAYVEVTTRNLRRD